MQAEFVLLERLVKSKEKKGYIDFKSVSGVDFCKSFFDSSVKPILWRLRAARPGVPIRPGKNPSEEKLL
jgi:hypothetical protein